MSCGTAGSPVETEKRTGPFTDKRGVSYAFEQDKTYREDVELLAPSVRWFYNWGVQPHEEVAAAAAEHNVLFYPMAWSPYPRHIEMLDAYLTENPQIEWIMGYNEPNLTDQANMTPRQAAKTWPKLIALAKKHNLKVLSPAMNYGTLQDYGNPWKWLHEFFGMDWYNEEEGKTYKNRGFKGVSLNDIDAISVHSYMPDAGALKGYIARFKEYGKPIWLTEFCAWDGINWDSLTHEQGHEIQLKFLSEAITYLELDPDVEKYAWFIPKGSEHEDHKPYHKLLSRTVRPDMNPPELIPLGIVYVNMGTCDKSVWVPAGQTFWAKDFTDMVFSDYIFKNDDPHWPRNERRKGAGVWFRPGTDSGGAPLDMHSFSRGKWVEYQVDVPAAKAYTFSLRNMVAEATEIAITVSSEAAGDRQPAATVSLSPTTAWRTSTVPVQLEAGRHTLRLTVVEGDCALNWLRLD